MIEKTDIEEVFKDFLSMIEDEEIKSKVIELLVIGCILTFGDTSKISTYTE